MFDRETEVRVATPSKPGRGGRKPGAGRKPNYLKHLAVTPITARRLSAVSGMSLPAHPRTS
jgi:hypothetical protein